MPTNAMRRCNNWLNRNYAKVKMLMRFLRVKKLLLRNLKLNAVSTFARHWESISFSFSGFACDSHTAMGCNIHEPQFSTLLVFIHWFYFMISENWTLLLLQVKASDCKKTDFKMTHKFIRKSVFFSIILSISKN